MTWSAKLAVTEIGRHGEAPIVVVAAASGPDEITSNTEGRIHSMELRIQLDEDTTSLRPGDIIQAWGSFNAQPAPAQPVRMDSA